MTTAHNDDVRTTGRRSWPAITSMVALALAAGSALLTLVTLLSYLTKDDQGIEMGHKLVLTASELRTTVAILLIAATLVLLSGAFGGRGDFDSMAALIITITGGLIALVMILAFLMSFGEKVEPLLEAGGGEAWPSRLAMLLGGIAAACAAAMANEARDRT